MTNYGSWDAKATDLVRQAEEEDAREAQASNEALGLSGGPVGPPVARAQAERRELDARSAERKDFISWAEQRVVDLTHESQDTEVELSGPEVEGKCIRLTGSQDVSYVVPKGASTLKLIFTRCQRIKVRLLEYVKTGTVEIEHCSDIEIRSSVKVDTVQADECPGDVLLVYADPGLAGQVVHQNCPSLRLQLQGDSDRAPQEVGSSDPVQLLSTLNDSGSFVTCPLARSPENEFPLFPTGRAVSASPGADSGGKDTEAAMADLCAQKAREARESGNKSFRDSDFAQAASQYSVALELDPSVGVLWANRAQCWLKLGNHKKALDDACKCTEVDPDNVKGWFRKGMALHAEGRYGEAITALLAAEERDPKNKQVGEAIKMAQLMARKHGPGGL